MNDDSRRARRRTVTLRLFGVIFGVSLLLSSCGGAQVDAAPKAPRGRPDLCEGSPALGKKYTGLLASARCEQDMFLKMADISAQLGVDCDHCHLKDTSNPDKFDYVATTPNKEIAAWMGGHFMPSIKPAKEGQRFRCKSCHTGEDGKGVAKLLGDPRDKTKAHEWMTLVLVEDFVAKDGSKLACKSCHGDEPSQPGWTPTVLLKTEQLPPH